MGTNVHVTAQKNRINTHGNNVRSSHLREHSWH